MRRLPILFLAALVLVLSGAAGRAEDRMSRFESFFSPGNSAGLSSSVEPALGDQPSVRDLGARAGLVVSSAAATTWSLTGRADHTRLGRPLVIPGTGVVFPDDFWDVQAGVSHLHQLGGGRQWGVQAALGSASDEPFHSIHETEVQATGSYFKPSGAHNSWLFLLSYSNNRTFANGIPLPGFAYMMRNPAKGAQLLVGFPFISARFAPLPGWSVSATLFGTNNQSLDISRQIKGPVRGYLAFDHGAQTWFRAGREDHKDRLIYDQKRAVLGVRGPVAGGVSVDAAAGRTFGRRFYEAHGVSSSDTSKVHFRSGWVFSLGLSGRWGARS